MIYEDLPMISKQSFTKYGWSLSSLIYSETKRLIKIYNDQRLVPNIEVDHDCFTSDREYIAAYSRAIILFVLLIGKQGSICHRLFLMMKCYPCNIGLRKTHLSA